MTDFHYPVSAEELDDAIVDDTPRFYVVSPSKFTILFLVTFGLYGVYWFYKNWDQYNTYCPDARQAGNGIWPLPRALFSVFFTHELFAKIKHYGRRHAQVAAWSDRSAATLLIVTCIVSNALDRAASRSIGSPTTDILSLLILVPLLYQFLSAQQKINRSCGDPEGQSNDKFSSANIAWTVLGGLCWCMALVGIFLPDASA